MSITPDELKKLGLTENEDPKTWPAAKWGLTLKRWFKLKGIKVWTSASKSVQGSYKSFVTIRTARNADGTYPVIAAEIRAKALRIIYGPNFAFNAEEPIAGNVRQGGIAMAGCQWIELLGIKDPNDRNRDACRRSVIR